MSPIELVPSSGTGSPDCTVSGATNCATGAMASKPSPEADGVRVSDPPALEVTFTTAGGAVTSVKVAWPLTSGPNPATVSVGASAPDSRSLDVALTRSSCWSASYVADAMAT